MSYPHTSIIQVRVQNVNSKNGQKATSPQKCPYKGWPCEIGKYARQPSRTACRGFMERVARFFATIWRDTLYEHLECSYNWVSRKTIGQQVNTQEGNTMGTRSSIGCKMPRGKVETLPRPLFTLSFHSSSDKTRGKNHVLLFDFQPIKLPHM